VAVGCGGSLGPAGSGPTWPAGSQPAAGAALFAGLCLCGVAEALGRLAASVSVERDWVPTAFEPQGEAVLARVNARMANMDLLAEMLGPLLAGAVFAAAPSPAVGFAAVALGNALSFLPQLWLLVAAQRHCPELRVPRSIPADQGASGEGSEQEGAWGTFLQHPSGVPMLTLSYALLFFTVLSSHDVVLTAFLAKVGLDPLVLSLFRALGAAAGVLGASAFELLAERAGGARSVAAAFIGMQTVAVFVAAGALTLRIGGEGLAPGWLGHTPRYLVPFLGAVVLSRVGLYGFDVGFSTLSQGLVDERRRGAVGAVTEGLCAFAQLCMYVAASAAAPSAGGVVSFDGLALASACSVGVAASVFALWSALYHEHEHYHSLAGGAGEAEAGHGHEQAHGHGHGQGHGHCHSDGAEHIHDHQHTIQQLRTLGGAADELHNGLLKHRHVHYHGPRLTWWK